MAFKTVVSFICRLYRFYPVLPMGKTDCFTQFYPTGFTHWVKLLCQPCKCPLVICPPPLLTFFQPRSKVPHVKCIPGHLPPPNLEHRGCCDDKTCSFLSHTPIVSFCQPHGVGKNGGADDRGQLTGG